MALLTPSELQARVLAPKRATFQCDIPAPNPKRLNLILDIKFPDLRSRLQQDKGVLSSFSPEALTVETFGTRRTQQDLAVGHIRERWISPLLSQGR